MLPLCIPLLLFFFLPHLPLPLRSLLQAAAYDLVHDYSGPSFFDGWDFYGSWDNLTLGDTWWLNRDDAFKQGLVYFTNEGHAVMKVDNTSDVAYNEKRASIRITSQALYGVGSLWVADIVHLPYGCSVWPAFWTKGTGTWPDGGEIDIIEGINLMDHNQMALHTLPGCFQAPDVNERGAPGTTQDCSLPSGCLVSETQPGSFGSAFAGAGGGVFAGQFDVAGIFIWFFPRAALPASLLQSASNPSAPLDISDWGPPSASYPASTCDVTEFFTAQNLVIDVTLCGIWAGLPEQYLPQCAGQGSTGVCYTDSVLGPPESYSNAYFEMSYVRAFTTGGAVPTPTGIAAPLQAAQVASLAKGAVGTGVWTSPEGSGGAAGEGGNGTGIGVSGSGTSSRGGSGTSAPLQTGPAVAWNAASVGVSCGGIEVVFGIGLGALFVLLL